MPPTQENREIEITTPLGKDVLLLQGLMVKEELGRLFTINVDLACEQDIDFAEILGQNVSIRMDLQNGERFFNGYITSISQAVNKGQYHRYHATIHPWLWMLTRTSDCRIFQEMTVPDIINEVCNGLGFSDIESKLTADYRTWEYCVQYRETDFNFISRLMEQEGIYYYFTHEEGKHTLNLADSSSSHSPLDDGAEIEYHPLSQGEVHGDVCINSWFFSQKIQPGTCVLTDYDFKLPKLDLQVENVIAKAHSQSEYEIFDYPGEYVASGDGSHYVRTRIEELHTQQAQAQGQGNVRRMGCGALFTLTNFTREDQNREYLLMSVTHNFQGDDFESSSGSSSSYTNSFSVVASDVVYRPARVTAKPVVQGPQTAVVVGPGGEEIYTNEHGQVKLQFHWDRYGESNENSSCWVRVSQLWAGKTWGGIHIPRIGQEVIVEFLEGDPDRPIVTGRVYNGDQTPPYELPANKTQSGIKSRSSMGGSGANFNEIRFEDKMGEEEMYIHAEKDQNTIVENDQGTLVQHDQTIRVDNDRAESIGRDRSLLVERDKSENVLRDKTIKVLGSHEEQVLKDMSIMVGTNLTEVVAINYMETVGAAMELTVGGALTISVGAAMVETVGINKTETVGKSSSETVGVSKTVEIGKNLNENIGESHTVEIGKDLKENIAGKHEEITKKEFMVSAKKIQFTADDEISFKVGKAEVFLKKNGDITIRGKKINIKGSGDVVIKGSQIKEN